MADPGNQVEKRLIVTVFSGLCNRLFAVLSAIRVARRGGHRVTVYWCEKLGRFGVQYQGSTNTFWEDLFERIPGVTFESIVGNIRLQHPPDLDISLTLPENLPRNAGGHLIMTQEIRRMIEAPKVVDPNKRILVINNHSFKSKFINNSSIF